MFILHRYCAKSAVYAISLKKIPAKISFSKIQKEIWREKIYFANKRGPSENSVFSGIRLG
jgi:hypothetical protein